MRRKKKSKSKTLKFYIFVFSLIAFCFIFFNKYGFSLFSNDDNKSSENEDILMKHTKKIAVVRVPDTPSHNEVKNYIKDTIELAGWTVELDSFQDKTPLGVKTFTNIIATLNPNAENFVILSAHYDSKLFDDFEFVGAVDSAASCAILLELAKSLKQNFRNESKWGIKIVFFDGEEAFVNWSDDDSIYGARHLAKRWETEIVNGKTMLSRIDIFILLDLLGHENSVLTSRFMETDHFFKKLIAAEDHLRSLGKIDKFSQRIFLSRKQFGAQVQDDHIPFLQRQVPVVHLIPIPFPRGWHSKWDTIDKLHLPTMKKLKDIIEIAVLNHTGMYEIKISNN